MKVALRDMRLEDGEMIRTWRNSPEVASFMYRDHFISPEEHSRWLRDALTNRSLCYWIIILGEEAVGLVNLYNIDPTNRRACWAFYLGSALARGKGVGGVVEYLILRHVFEERKFNRLCCEVLASNPAVIEMHKRFGFIEEGRFRQHVLRGDHPIDVLSMAILRREWDQKKPEILAEMQRKGLLDGEGSPI